MAGRQASEVQETRQTLRDAMEELTGAPAPTRAWTIEYWPYGHGGWIAMGAKGTWLGPTDNLGYVKGPRRFKTTEAVYDFINAEYRRWERQYRKVHALAAA